MWQVKCHQYYPTGKGDEDTEFVFEDVGLKVKFIQEDDVGYYVVRTLTVEDIEVQSCSIAWFR